MNKIKNNKRLFTIIFAVLLVSVTAVSAFAILRSISDKSNGFTIGSQTIDISEDKFEISSDDIIDNGEPFKKNPTITNQGKNPCYIRVYLGISDFELIDNIDININEEWIKSDDGYYYNRNVLEPGDSIEFFSEMTVSDTDNFDCDVFIYAESVDANQFDYSSAWSRFNVVAPA